MTEETGQASPHAIADREEGVAEALAMGIDEPCIAELVDRFYASVREDAMRGPVFDARVDDWPKHLGQMNRFWQSILLSAGNFTGNPMMKHLAIPTIGQEHFQQWLRLFYQTLHAIAPSPEAVAHEIGRAHV